MYFVRYSWNGLRLLLRKLPSKLGIISAAFCLVPTTLVFSSLIDLKVKFTPVRLPVSGDVKLRLGGERGARAETKDESSILADVKTERESISLGYYFINFCNNVTHQQ